MDNETEPADPTPEQTAAIPDPESSEGPVLARSKWVRRLLWAMAIVLVFILYVKGISHNPPGFYVDESGIAYNAYLVAQTGAGEFGPRFPLFFQFYTGGFTQYASPTSVYLLAVFFWLFGPGILLARLLAAASMYAAALLLGSLAARVTGKRMVGFIVAVSALLTPWLFEVGRLMLETYFYPMAVVLFLWAVYRAQQKNKWAWSDCVWVALSLTLLTYTYTIGRLLAPLLALGLLCFATRKRHLFAVVKTWLIYGVTLLPLVVFNWRNPELVTRFYLVSYIKPQSTLREIIPKFASRFLEDISPSLLLLRGDLNPRHHLPDALGSMFFVTFILAVSGIIVVLIRHRRESWWWFVLFGLVASVVPGAMTGDKFHTLRMIAYPMFMLLMTAPALNWLLDEPAELQTTDSPVTDVEPAKGSSSRGKFWLASRDVILGVLLVALIAEASYFHWQYHHEGYKRGYVFDTDYKALYDLAVAQPNRPIYLVDNYWGPAYMHAFWYAVLEGRNHSEFIHQPYNVRPPAGVIVLSTERNCSGCVLISQKSIFILYRTTQ